MPIITRPEEETEVFGLLDELSVSPEERSRARQSVLSDSLEQTLPALAQTAVERAIEDLQDPRRLTREQAAAEAEARGLDLAGVGESGISVGGLNVILRRSHRQRERQRQVEQGDLGGLEQLGLSFLAQLPDPINLVPFGAGAKARTVAGAVGKGVLAGGVASAAVEPAYFALSRYSGIDYDLADSAANVAFGAGLGGVFGGAGYAYSQVASARERRAAAAVAARQAANNEAIDVSSALPDGVPDVIVTPREGGSQFVEAGPDDLTQRPTETRAFGPEDVARVEQQRALALADGEIDRAAAFARGEIPERRSAAFEDEIAVPPFPPARREVSNSGVTLSVLEDARRAFITAKLSDDTSAIIINITKRDDGKTLYIDSVFPEERGFISQLDANALGPRNMLKVYRALKEAFPDAEAIEGFRVTGARTSRASRFRAGGDATVPLRARRGPAAIDPSVAAEAELVDAAAGAATPETATAVTPLDAEAAELETRLSDELEALDPEARAEVEAELKSIDESFTDEDTYVNTIGAATRCALTTGVDGVV